MALKDIIYKVIIPIVSAVCSGVLVFFLTPDWQTKARQNEWIPKSEWKAEIKEKGWILKTECPAYPLKISIIGPGRHSALSIEKSYGKSRKIESDIIAQLSRKFNEEQSEVGVVLKLDDDDHFRIVFPKRDYQSSGNYYKVSGEGKVFRFNDLYIPYLNNPKSIIVRVFVTDDSSAIGSIYLSFEEIKNLPYVLSYSNEMEFNVKVDS
ncbi:hypothetical protein, partial [Desulfosarcina cetonica]|uniref:hypothetical protein n=1 Tax=Desulfosarcina cetonica TaxID=90730 RepID=UPI0012EEABF5